MHLGTRSPLSRGHWQRRAALASLASWSLLVAPLCGCEDTSAADEEEAGNILLTDDNNYQSVSELSIPYVVTASGTDLDICWSDVVDDIQCHDVDPLDDIDNVALLRFLNAPESEVEEKLVASYLSMSDIAGYADYNTDGESTCAKLSDMTFFEEPFALEKEYVDDDSYSYMLVFTTGTDPGVGARTMIFLRPTTGEQNTDVNAQPGCEKLEFNVDLSSGEPLDMATDGPWIIDWREVTRDGAGLDIDQATINGVLIGFYEGLSVSDLEEQIFDLEYIYTNLWEMEIEGGRTADLSEARERDTNERFEGFETDEDGIWVLGLMCSVCQNPAPIVLTVVNPTG